MFKGRNVSTFQCFDFSIFLSSPDSLILSMVIVRETEKDLRLAQSKEFKELDPLVTTYHLPSMKIFFTNILTEQVHSKLIHSTLTKASFPFL